MHTILNMLISDRFLVGDILEKKIIMVIHI